MGAWRRSEDGLAPPSVPCHCPMQEALQRRGLQLQPRHLLATSGVWWRSRVWDCKCHSLRETQVMSVTTLGRGWGKALLAGGRMPYRFPLTFGQQLTGKH